jgi:hypothetical protein
LLRLQAGKISEVLANNLGQPRVAAKKLGWVPKDFGKKSGPKGHSFFLIQRVPFNGFAIRTNHSPNSG